MPAGPVAPTSPFGPAGPVSPLGPGGPATPCAPVPTSIVTVFDGAGDPALSAWATRKPALPASASVSIPMTISLMVCYLRPLSIRSADVSDPLLALFLHPLTHGSYERHGT